MNKLKKIKLKKAQIASTLTWFIALIIILFIMVIFVLATLSIVTEKKPKIEDKATNFQILNLEIAQMSGKTVEQELIEWAAKFTEQSYTEARQIKLTIEQGLKETFQQQQEMSGKTNQCYLFSAEIDPEISPENIQGMQGSQGTANYFELKKITVVNSEHYLEKLSKKAFVSYLFTSNKKIKLLSYIGDC